MVTINDSSLRANVYEEIYDTLTNANLLSSTATITAAYIDSSTAPFPQVVVNPVDVDKDGFTFDRSISNKTITVMIDIYTKKNKDKDLLADEIDTVITPLKMGGVSLIGWSESNALESPNENKVHLKTITLAYRRVS